MVAFKEMMLLWIQQHAVPRVILLLGRSIRWTRLNEECVREKGMRGENCIFCFWHNRFLLMPFIYQGVRGRKNICVMASLSRDGEYIVRVLRGFRFEVARGSSSRGGEGAVLEMASMLAEGLDAAVTPDGPKGPLYRVQPGVILLASLTGVPIVPATYAVSRAKRLRSWDRFIVPLPFSRGILLYGDPIIVPKDAVESLREEARARLEETLRTLNREAAALAGTQED